MRNFGKLTLSVVVPRRGQNVIRASSSSSGAGDSPSPGDNSSAGGDSPLPSPLSSLVPSAFSYPIQPPLSSPSENQLEEERCKLITSFLFLQHRCKVSRNYYLKYKEKAELPSDEEKRVLVETEEELEEIEQGEALTHKKKVEFWRKKK